MITDTFVVCPFVNFRDQRAVAAEGWKVVWLTRLSPVFPFTLLSCAFGLTRVKLGLLVSLRHCHPSARVYPTGFA